MSAQQAKTFREFVDWVARTEVMSETESLEEDIFQAKMGLGKAIKYALQNPNIVFSIHGYDVTTRELFPIPGTAVGRTDAA